MDENMQLTINCFRLFFPDISWLLVKSPTFHWQLSKSLTFSGFPAFHISGHPANRDSNLGAIIQWQQKCEQQLRPSTVQFIAQTATHQWIYVYHSLQYAWPRRREQNLFVCNGKSDTKVTNNRRSLYTLY